MKNIPLDIKVKPVIKDSRAIVKSLVHAQITSQAFKPEFLYELHKLLHRKATNTLN